MITKETKENQKQMIQPPAAEAASGSSDFKVNPTEKTADSMEEELAEVYRLYESYRKREEQNELEVHRRQHEIYAAHGITADKVEGVSEYYRAMFKGMAILASAITAIMILVSFLCCGITSSTNVFTVLALAIEAELLAQENLKNVPARILARVFLLFPPAMSTSLVVCDLIDLPESILWLLLVIFEGVSIGLAIFGGVMFFIYNPYHANRRQMRAAKAEIKAMMKERRRAEKKDQKKSESQRKKERKQLRKLEKKEERQSERRQLRVFVERQKQRAEELSKKITHKNDVS